MNHYLVTGGAGFIGSHLTARLVRDGAKVRVLDNFSTGKHENLAGLEDSIEVIEGSVADAALVERAVEGVDVVFHQAALASVPRSVELPLETHDACATGTVILLDACRKAGVRRLVYAGSSSAYGNQPELPKQERQLPEVVSPYAAAKLAGELYCQAFAASYGLETVRLRYFNVFGPRQDPNSPYSAVIPLFIAALMAGKQPTIFGDGSQSRDFIFVENVVEANLAAAEATGVNGKVYNIAGGEPLTVRELLKELCRLLTKPYSPVFAPPRAGDVLHSWADISAAKRDLGFQPRIGLQEGLEQTVDYYAAGGDSREAGE
ncbi:MAG: SDR family oxidoreductase [Planctomycetaceae bacterium]